MGNENGSALFMTRSVGHILSFVRALFLFCYTYISNQSNYRPNVESIFVCCSCLMEGPNWQNVIPSMYIKQFYQQVIINYK